MPAQPSIRAMASNDDTVIIWKYDELIPNCWGFNLLRQHQGESEAAAEPIWNSVGFEGEPHQDGELNPTTVWPLQRFMWTDYYVRQGDVVRYKIIPMVNENNRLVKKENLATDWSDWVKVHNGDHEVYYNRGLVSSQFVARRMLTITKPGKPKPKLDDELLNPKSAIREFMGGTLVDRIYKLLEEVRTDPSLKLYAALYECNDSELIRRLNAIGKRANIILANGAFGKKADPEAENAKKLKQVTLTRRKVKTGHFAHNKFVVVTRTADGAETPIRVLTGSTNWTLNGLFKQANNGVVFSDPSIALYFWEEWKKILADCKDGVGLYGQPFKEHNKTVKHNNAQDIRTWFTPTAALADLNDAKALLHGANKGILFLMFKPGAFENKFTLYNEIHAVAKKRKDLLVHGVINTDPGGAKKPSIEFMHKGKPQKGSFQGVTKASIQNSFEFWKKELGSPNVTIHSKLIVIDPFSDNPIVMTGSHNMGEKASGANDDNLNIVTKNRDVAIAYAVHIMSVYHHYRWRYYRSSNGTKLWDGNIKKDDWQNWYWLSSAGSNNRKELEFWWS